MLDQNLFSSYIMSYHFCLLISHTGSSFELVEATGVIVVGHFSVDGELKKEHYTAKHHNMLVVQGRKELIEEIIELLSFPGQSVLHLVTDLESGQGTSSFMCDTVILTSVFFCMEYYNWQKYSHFNIP